MKEHPAQVGDHWVVDEMRVRVGGDHYYNWNVMDSSTHYILASHLSKERTAAEATKVLRKALAATSNPSSQISRGVRSCSLPFHQFNSDR